MVKKKDGFSFVAGYLAGVLMPPSLLWKWVEEVSKGQQPNFAKDLAESLLKTAFILEAVQKKEPMKE